jgi:hypothetical protein
MSVLILRPNADSTPLEQYSQPASPTTHYDKVDEDTLDVSDGCDSKAETSAYTDIYEFPNHTSESGTINSVTVKCNCKYVLTGTDATTVYVYPAVKIGATVYYSSAKTLTTSSAEYNNVWTTNPATSAAWSWTEIDALLAGDKLTSHRTDKSNFRRSYCHQLWVEVDYTAGGGSTVKPHYYYLQQ